MVQQIFLQLFKLLKTFHVISDVFIAVILYLTIPSNFKCANTSSLQYLVNDQNDVLLYMGLITRLTKVEKNENGIASVYSTLTKLENEQNLREALSSKREEVKEC